MSAAPQEPAIRTLDDFPAHYAMATRWEDEDVYGHVNNVVYYSFFDTAVNGWLMQATGTDIRRLDTYGIVAETGCAFRHELRFPGEVHAGLRVSRLGRTSVVYEIALFQGDLEAPAAIGRFVHVYVSGDDRTPTPVPDVIREVLEPLT